MRHSVKKIKFKGGHDATRIIVRQLLNNFIKEGKLISSQKKVSVLRSEIEKVVHKAKTNTQADRDFLTSKLADKRSIHILQQQIVPVFKNRIGGYVRIIKLLSRGTDGTSLAKLEWVEPMVINKDPKPSKGKRLEKDTTTETPKVKKRALKTKISSKKAKS